MKWVAIIFIAIWLIGLIIMSVRKIIEWSLFKGERNPYRRWCKKCGACQVMYQSNIEGQEHIVWWEEIYPIGNDPKCKCHSFAEYKS